VAIQIKLNDRSDRSDAEQTGVQSKPLSIVTPREGSGLSTKELMHFFYNIRQMLVVKAREYP
jgi:hypothetical protein